MKAGGLSPSYPAQLSEGEVSLSSSSWLLVLEKAPFIACESFRPFLGRFECPSEFVLPLIRYHVRLVVVLPPVPDENGGF